MKFSVWSVSASAILFDFVTASPITAEGNSSLVLESRATPTTVTSEILTNMEFYVQYAAAAYCNSESSLVGSEVTCGSSACPLVEAAAVTNYAYLGYDQSEVEGFLAIDSTNKLIVASYMGTQSLSNFIADLLVPLDSTDLCSGCKLHEGFQYAWQDVQQDTMTAIKAAVAAYPSYSVVTTGHSLGGAVATIAGAYFRAAGIPTDIYSYGSPRVGNEAFVEFVDAQDGAHYRVTHTNDPIPRYPGKFLGFRHTSPEFWLSTGSATTTSYGISDIEVCEGTANTDCNDDSSNIILTSHSYYFQKVSVCG